MIKNVNIPRSPLSAIKIALILIYYWIVNLSIKLFIKLFYHKVSPKVKRLLIFRTGSLGDSLCAIPSIMAIRKQFPEVEIDILSNTGIKSLVSLKAFLKPDTYTEFIDYLGIPPNELIKILRKKKYDAVIQLSQNQASIRTLYRDMIFFRFLLGIKSGFGWEYSTVRFWRKIQESNIRYFNETERLLITLKLNDIKINEHFGFDIYISPEDTLLVETKIKEINEQFQLPLIAMVVGAKRPQNRWPIKNFREIAIRLSKRFTILIIGGAEDQQLALQLEDIPGVINCCGVFTPVQSGLIINQCLLCLSNDTGPLHLTYAFGTPLIGLFSARDFPFKWFPPENDNNIVIRRYGIPCALCLSESCSNNICMQQIGVDEVYESIGKLLTKLGYPNKN